MSGTGSLLVISAGAGTGKTHRLAEELHKALTDDAHPVAPEGVVAVTFTRSAAAELESRVRTALLDAGHTELARRLASARIGTVHSVCHRLVRDFAFTLGVSPDLEVIDDAIAASFFQDAIDDSLTDDERSDLDDLEQRMSLGDNAQQFFSMVRKIVDRARGNSLDDDDTLARSATSSLEHLSAVLTDDGVIYDGATIDQALLDAMQQAPPKGQWRQAIEHAKDLLAGGERLPWNEWRKLEQSTFRPIATAAAAHIHHPLFLDDMRRLTELSFHAARRALKRYADDKRTAGVVDFNDLEHLAKRAVADDDVRATLHGDIQLLLVDEFQDTNGAELGVFLALHQIAQRTIIVGDEKQSIFGFRDARPEYLQQMAKQASHKTRLDTSYRSRPPLVDAVNAVFSRAFAGHHHADDVSLRAKLEHDPEGLGPHVERWAALLTEEGERVPERDIAAAGIAELLGPRMEFVRPHGGEQATGIRPVQAKDIAVLCRSRAECRSTARLLAKLHVPVVLAQRGLSNTAEARLMAAALALWLDERDTLARVTLVTLLEPERPDIVGVVAHSQNDGSVFADHPAVKALIAAANAERHAGLLLAFDRCCAVLRVHDLLGAQPPAAQRLADLAALRALCVRFVNECHARGRAPSITAFLARLEDLRADRGDDDSHDDDRGVVAGDDAVTVLTYHKAKGREWPIVVLLDLTYPLFDRPFDVELEGEISFDAPATPATPWLRAWPSPYHEHTSRGALIKQLSTSPLMERARARAKDEARRLLYVAFTRARDRLVVVGDETVWSRGTMEALSVDGRPLCGDAKKNDGIASWAGASVHVKVHKPQRGATSSKLPSATTLAFPPLPHAPAPAYAPMFSQPSAQEGIGIEGERIALGNVVTVQARSREELNPLGSCVHAFLAWDAFVDVNDARRRPRARALLEAFAAAEFASEDDLLEIATRLWRALDARFPGHTRRTEVPVLHRTESLVRGQIDLLVTHDGKAVIVDHKTTFDDDVTGYAGQLMAYADAVRAAGHDVADDAVRCFIHLPLLGALVEVSPQKR